MQKRFIFLIWPRTHVLDLAGPDQVLSEAIFYQAPFEIVYCAPFPEQAGTASGLRFGGMQHYSTITPRPGDYLLIPGMDLDLILDVQSSELQAVYHWISEAYACGCSICSVCTGAFVLGAIGLLHKKNCTTHWKYTRRLQERFASAQVQENVLYTEDAGIFTSAGIASGIDLALYLVEREMGAHFAHKVAREVVVYSRRNGQQAQQSVFMSYRDHIHAGIHAAQDWLIEHLHERNALPQLAEKAHMSPRNFTRIFRLETGITVGAYIALLRKETLRQLLKNPNLSRAEIAGHIGLSSERQLSRVMKGM